MSKYIDDNRDTFFIGLGVILGLLVGEIFAMCMMRIAAHNAVGFSVECADKILNNPNVSIDTTYTIHNQDTIFTYHFVKNK